MEQPQENTDQKIRENLFEPFPKPNTIPDGWDLSEITSTAAMKVVNPENFSPLSLD